MNEPHHPIALEKPTEPEPSPAHPLEQDAKAEAPVGFQAEAPQKLDGPAQLESGPDSKPKTQSDVPEERLRPPGWPEFLDDYPEAPELKPIVEAFARGDYRTVRLLTRSLPSSTAPELRSLAENLVARTHPDPLTKLLFVLACALFAFVALWSMLGHGH